MNEILEFLDMRVSFLQGFGEDEEEDTDDGEEIFSRGEESGKYKEAVFIRKKIKEILSK
jgi:hypothetical protein